MVSALPWSWCLLFCRAKETMTNMKIYVMWNFASVQQNIVLPLRQNCKVTLRPHSMVCLKCSVDPPKSLLVFVSLKENTRPTFSERLWKQSTQAVTSARSLRMSPPAQTVFSKRELSSPLPSSYMWPLLACLGISCSCRQPHFPLLEPARKLARSPLHCRRSGGLGHCIHSSPFWTLWLLPHWPKMSLLSAMVHSEEDSWGWWHSPLCRGWWRIETYVLFICCFRDLTRAQQASGSTSTGAHFVPIEEGIVKPRLRDHPRLRDPYTSTPGDCLLPDSGEIELWTVQAPSPAVRACQKVEFLSLNM